MRSRRVRWSTRRGFRELEQVYACDLSHKVFEFHSSMADIQTLCSVKHIIHIHPVICCSGVMAKMERHQIQKIQSNPTNHCGDLDVALEGYWLLPPRPGPTTRTTRSESPVLCRTRFVCGAIVYCAECPRPTSPHTIAIRSLHPSQGIDMPSQASSRDDTDDLQRLMERLFVSDLSIESVTWTRTRTTESITLTRSTPASGPPPAFPPSALQSQHGGQTPSRTSRTISTPPPADIPDDISVTSPETPTPRRQSGRATSERSTDSPRRHGVATNIYEWKAPIPSPQELKPPTQLAERYYVISVGQEVGIFFDWLDVSERVDGVAGARHKSYRTWSDALDAYTRHYNTKSVRAVPKPGGRFWPKPPPPTLSEEDLWSVVDGASQ